MKDGCNGRSIMFRLRSETNDEWKYGIVSSLSYLETVDVDSRAYIFEWKGTMSSDHMSSDDSYPAFLDCKTWNDARVHFKLVKYQSKDIFFEFTNQVRGVTFDGSSISHRTRNETDGGVQCHPDGPDMIPMVIPISAKVSTTQSLLKNKLTDEVMGRRSLYIHPKKKKKRKRGSRKTAAKHNATNVTNAKTPDDKEELELAKSWQRSPRRAVDKSQKKLVLISSVNKVQATNISESDKKLFFAPTIASVRDQSSPLVTFSGVTKQKYKELCELELTEENYDANLVSRQSVNHQLLDCYAIELPTSVDANAYHHYATVYPSNACPPINTNDESIQSYTLPDESITVHCMFVDADKFEGEGYVPLSVGLHDSTLHGISIQPKHLQLINKAVGVGGLFTKRNRSSHSGQLSFVGPRSTKSCSQPSPTEGPNESGYWYYRKRLSHFFWPFVLHLMMFLASRISLVSYYQYIHLSKLLPLSNDDPIRQDFCDIGILTQDYDSSLHVDQNDTLDKLDTYFKDELKMLSTTKYLSTYHQQRATHSLNHVTHWGVSTPTTCGYQVVAKKESIEVEIIQYFCCKGLGICYRINNYWVHLFPRGQRMPSSSKALHEQTNLPSSVTVTRRHLQNNGNIPQSK